MNDELPPGIVICGACKRPIRRSNKHWRIPQGMEDLPLIVTRTLVDGEFLPSCSDVCAGMLRARIGSAKRSERSYAV